MKDYYKSLQVESKATFAEIKKAYRKLAKKYHPDINVSWDAEVRFKEVSTAYGVLSCPRRRNQFDAFRLAGSLSQGSLDLENVEIEIRERACNVCCTTGTITIECSVCSGKGYSYEKVPYGKNKVNSKIVCTTCSSIGKIFHNCSLCLGTGKTKYI